MNPTRILRCGRFPVDLSAPRVMGVVNVTPDSFSDGGRTLSPTDAIGHSERLIDEGADLIDIGAESTRPRATAIPIDEEWRRLGPVLAALRDARVPISVDTRNPEVMRRALDSGASMINDISGFTMDDAIGAVAASGCAVCVMHMQGEPGTMQQAPTYTDVVAEVTAFLDARAVALTSAGITADRIVVDPGFGFGKTLAHNLALLRALQAVGTPGWPVLVGLSRKGMIGTLTGRPSEDRVAGSIAAALAAVARGAAIVRVHDVAATVDALAVWLAAQDFRGSADDEARAGQPGPR